MIFSDSSVVMGVSCAELYFDRGSFYDFTSLGELQHLQLQKHLDCGTGMSVWFHSSADTFRIDV